MKWDLSEFFTDDINRKTIVKFLSTLLLSLFITFLSLLICYLLLPDWVWDTHNDMTCHSGFARRWDGTCNGWTKALAQQFILGDLMHWHAYLTVSIFIFIYHPIKSVLHAAAIYATCLFILGCGGTHLFDIYTIFNPVYNAQGWYMIVNGIISEYAMIFVLIVLVKQSVISKTKS